MTTTTTNMDETTEEGAEIARLRRDRNNAIALYRDALEENARLRHSLEVVRRTLEQTLRRGGT